MQCRKTKVIYPSHITTDIKCTQWTNQNSKQVHVTGVKRGKTRASASIVATDWFEFYSWLVEKVARKRFIQSQSEVKQNQSNEHQLLSTLNWKPLYCNPNRMCKLIVKPIHKRLIATLPLWTLQSLFAWCCSCSASPQLRTGRYKQLQNCWDTLPKNLISSKNVLLKTIVKLKYISEPPSHFQILLLVRLNVITESITTFITQHP